jgi:Tfp pilus assembly protein PilV
MKQHTDNQRGFALIYALVILLLASIGGTAVLFMSQKGRIEATDYAAMRSSSLAAVAATKAFERQFLTDPATALAQLRAYPSKTWLLGSTPSSTQQKVKFWDGKDSPEYAARILSYDSMTQMIVIEGVGYGSNGGRKKVIASYRLDGFSLSDRPLGTGYALYLGGSIENLNSSIIIKGDTYLSLAGSTSDQHINTGGTKRIEGNLVTGSSTNRLHIAENFTVTGKALIQCRLWTQNAIFKIRGNAGFTNSSLFDGNSNTEVRVDGSAYFTQSTNFGFKYCIDGDDGGGTTVYYNTSSISADRFKDFDHRAQISSATVSYLESQLGLSSTNATFTTNFPTWETGVVKMVNGGISGPIVDTWWNEQMSAGKLYQNEWLVLKLKGDISTNTPVGTFHKKVIWITENYTINANKNWYNCAPESNSFIYVTGTSGLLNNFGIANGSMFRGFIFINNTSSSAITYQFGTGSDTAIFYGAIHHKSSKFDLNSGGPWILDFSDGSLGQSAIQELVNTGLLLAPGQSTLPTRVMTLVDLKIRPKLLNLQL